MTFTNQVFLFFFNVSMLYHCVNRELCQWVSELQTVDNTCSLGVTETLSR